MFNIEFMTDVDNPPVFSLVEFAENPVNIKTFFPSTLYEGGDKFKVALFIVFEYIKNLGLLIFRIFVII